MVQCHSLLLIAKEPGIYMNNLKHVDDLDIILKSIKIYLWPLVLVLFSLLWGFYCLFHMENLYIYGISLASNICRSKLISDSYRRLTNRNKFILFYFLFLFYLVSFFLFSYNLCKWTDLRGKQAITRYTLKLIEFSKDYWPENYYNFPKFLQYTDISSIPERYLTRNLLEIR